MAGQAQKNSILKKIPVKGNTLEKLEGSSFRVLFSLDPSVVQQPEPLSAPGYLSLLSFGADKQRIISLGARPAGNSWNQSLVFTAPAGSREGRQESSANPFSSTRILCTRK